MPILYTTVQIRELEKIAIDEFAVLADGLMQRAGEAAYSLLCQSWPQAKRIVICCGGGNNGGDGYVLAEIAKRHHLEVTVYSVTPPGKLNGIAEEAFLRCKASGVTLKLFSPDVKLKGDVIVDALLGIGMKGQVKEPMLSAIKAINQAGCEVLSIDLPSGLNADTGAVSNAAVKAKRTITFIGLKRGLVTANAFDYCGTITCDDLALPPQLFQRLVATTRMIEPTDLTKPLAPRMRNVHKAMFGKLVVVGGDYGMGGAVAMTGEAAFSVGAGLVTVATRPEHISALIARRPELMSCGVLTSADLKSALAKATVIVLGPGLGQSVWSDELYDACINVDKPKVVDADGLVYLAKNPFHHDNWVLTPHPGEAARLLGVSTDEVQADRFAAVAAIQQKFGGVCVLKGAGTVIQTDDATLVCPLGNPGMATAGMGDILSGVIGGLLGQQLNLATAAICGVYLHAQAGDLAAKAQGERGLFATDLLPNLQRLVNPT